MFDVLVYLGTFLSLGFFIPSRWDGSELFTFSVCALILILSMMSKSQRDIPLKGIGFFLLVVFLSDLFRPVHRQVFENALIGALVIKQIAERTKITRQGLGRMLFCYAVVCNTFLILQLLKMDPIYLPKLREVCGAATMPWIMGSIAALSVPFIAAVNPLCCLILLPMLYYSNSVACFAIAALMFFWPLFKYAPKITAAVIVSSAVGGALVLHKIPGVARFHMWKGCLAYLHNIWIGNGFGAWAHEGFLKMNGLTPEYWRWAHNDIFQVFFEGGILSLLAVSCAVLGLLWKRNLAVVGVLLLSIVHPVFHCDGLLMLIVVIIALAFKEETWTRSA